jgi:hypothetical protein
MAAGAAARADLLRWCASVAARDRREPPPTPELWNHHKLDTDQVLARELHLAGSRVRKSTIRTATTPARLPDAKEEVAFHVVAYALNAAAEEEARSLGGFDQLDCSSFSETEISAPAHLLAKMLKGAAPFMSTRGGVAGGRGIPARMLVDLEAAAADRNSLGGASLLDVSHGAGGGGGGGKGASSSSSAAATRGSGGAVEGGAVPGDVAVRGLEIALATMRVVGLYKLNSKCS